MTFPLCRIRTALVLLIGVNLAAAVAISQETAPRTASIEGFVVDAVSGEPLSGVTVIGPGVPKPGFYPAGSGVRPVRGNPLAPENQPYDYPTANSKADGTFVLEQLGSGSVAVTFSKPGYLNQSVPHTLAEGERLKIAAIRLTAEAIVSGRVIDDRAQLIVDAPVTAYVFVKLGATEVLESRAQTSSNDRGEFRFSGVRPGRYLIGFAPPPRGQGAERWSADATDFSRRGPVLYPGVGSTTKADLIV
jgi:hypothetical protein